MCGGGGTLTTVDWVWGVVTEREALLARAHCTRNKAAAAVANAAFPVQRGLTAVAGTERV